MNEDRLRRLLEDAAPAAPDGHPVLDTLRPEFRRARRRRQTRLTALGGVALVALVVGAGIAFDRDGGPSDLELRGAPHSRDDGPDTVPDGEQTDEPAGAEGRGQVIADSGAPDHLTPDRSVDQPASVTSNEADVATPSTVGPTSTPQPTSSAAPLPTSPPAPVSPVTEVTEGGTVTVALIAGEMTIIDVVANQGWTYDIEDDFDEVKVDFERDDTRIRVRFDIEDGELVSSVDRDHESDE